MARPVKKTPADWRKEILNAAQNLFISKGYEETPISDIMDMVGGAKGLFYRCFQSEEDVMYTLGNQMFFEDNPFEAVKGRDGLNSLQKIRLLLTLNQSDVISMKWDKWLLCPVYVSKIKLKLREDTVLEKFPLFYPKCKQETLINIRQINMSVIRESDAKTQSR